MADTLTIAAAARLCGCPRSTLQRAIRAGRLHLDAHHQLDPDELTQAGYLDAPAARQARAAVAPRPQPDLAPLLRDMQRTLERLSEAVELLTQELRQRQQPRAGRTQHPAPRTRQERSTERAAAAQRPRASSEPLAYDTTRYTLGALCPRGHDYAGTGQSLRRRHNGGCAQCNIEQQRARRQARRQAPQ